MMLCRRSTSASCRGCDAARMAAAAELANVAAAAAGPPVAVACPGPEVRGSAGRIRSCPAASGTSPAAVSASPASCRRCVEVPEASLCTACSRLCSEESTAAVHSPRRCCRRSCRRCLISVSSSCSCTARASTAGRRAPVPVQPSSAWATSGISRHRRRERAGGDLAGGAGRCDNARRCSAVDVVTVESTLAGIELRVADAGLTRSWRGVVAPGSRGAGGSAASAALLPCAPTAPAVGV